MIAPTKPSKPSRSLARPPDATPSGRSRGLLYDWLALDGSSLDAPTMCVLDDKFSLVTLKQTGDWPWIDNWQLALGPTGLVVTEDGSRFWIGVPTAG